jgi:hypothetical protein
MAAVKPSSGARAIERGDGETFTYTASAPVVFGLLVLGVALTALALGRIGASAAAERGAYDAGTAVRGADAGIARARYFLGRFTGATGTEVAAVPEDRAVRLTTRRTFSYGAPVIGRFNTTQDGAMRKRVERFYRGGGEE